MGTSASIARAGAERIDELEPLWRSMQAHHGDLAGELPPVRDADESWRLRSDQYRSWMAAGTALLFLAELDGRAVGYLMLKAGGAWPTWDLGERVAEVESLAVLADVRGCGIGGALMQAARAATRELGAQAMVVGLAHTNDGARRFYEREGFRPFYLDMLADV